MIPEPCNTHTFLYARWSTFSGRFHTVSFTMQSHDQNLTSSLKASHHAKTIWIHIFLVHIRNELCTSKGRNTSFTLIIFDGVSFNYLKQPKCDLICKRPMLGKKNSLGRHEIHVNNKTQTILIYFFFEWKINRVDCTFSHIQFYFLLPTEKRK